MNIDWKDIAVRAGKTFLQGFLASFSVAATGAVDLQGLNIALFAGLVAGIAAVASFLQNFIAATK